MDFSKLKRTIRGIALNEPFNDLAIYAKRYGQEAMNRVRNLFRTRVLASPTRVAKMGDDDLHIIFRDLNNEELKTAWDLIAAKTSIAQYDKFYASAIKEGQTPASAIKFAEFKVPNNMNVSNVQKLYDELWVATRNHPQGQRIFDAMDRYQRYMKEILADEIKRGNINEIDWNGWYFHRQLLRYYDPDVFPAMPRKAKKMFRAYLQRQMGGSEDVVINENVLRGYFLQHHMANIIDDFTQEAHDISDILHGASGLKAVSSEDDLRKIFNGGLEPKPGETYPVNGNRYVGSQPHRGNNMYKEMVVSAPRLDRKIEGFLDEVGDDPEPWQITQFLDSLTTDEPGETIKHLVLAMGKRRKTYLIPEPIYKAINNMKPPSADPALQYVFRMNQYWRIMTLMQSGLKYQIPNIFGDGINTAFLGDIRAVQYLPVVYRIRNWAKRQHGLLTETIDPKAIRKATEGQKVQLNDNEQMIVKVMDDENVLTGSGLYETTRLAQEGGIKGTIKKPLSLWTKINYMREANTRIAITAMKLQEFLSTGGRIENGQLVGDGKITSVTFGDDIVGLTPQEKIGYIARNAAVDYLWVNEMYRTGINGVILNFATWPQKNAVNWVKYMQGSMKKGFSLHSTGWERVQSALPIALTTAPLLALYNNLKTSDDKKYAWHNLGPDKNNPYTVILATKSDAGQPDNKPDKAFIYQPAMPNWIAMQVFGFDKTMSYISAMKRGLMTPTEMAKKIAIDIPTGPFRFAGNLLMPLAKFGMGVSSNKDAYSGGPVYQTGAPPEVQADQMFGYFLRCLVSPMGNYFREHYGSTSFKASEMADDVVDDAKRIQGAVSAFMTGNMPEEDFKKFTTSQLWNDKGPFAILRALGFKQVDLLANKNRELEQRISKISQAKSYDMGELANAYMNDLIEQKTMGVEKPQNLQDLVEKMVADGKLSPASVTIEGVNISEDPEGWHQRLVRDFTRRVASDASINRLFRKYAAQSDPETKEDIIKAYRDLKYNQLLKHIQGAGEDVQINVMKTLLDDLNYNFGEE
jgi:hypothetical protein